MITINKKIIRKFLIAMCHPGNNSDIDPKHVVPAIATRENGNKIYIPFFKIEASSKEEFLDKMKEQALDLWDYLEENQL